MKPLLVSIFLASALLLGCSSDENPKLKIIANSWIGYSPLFYARETGKLSELDMELLHVVSLGEGVSLFKSGIGQGFTGTQFEYDKAKSRSRDLVPAIFFNRSNGGDMVLGNQPIEAYTSTDAKISAFLEIDSVNQLLLINFLNENGINKQRVIFINKDQAHISTLDAKNLDELTLISTYSPYDSILEKRGFNELGSTKDSQSLLILDALYVDKTLLMDHSERFSQLQEMMINAFTIFKTNPEKYYQVVNPYLGFESFNDFMLAADDIIWLISSVTEDEMSIIKQSRLPTEYLIK